MPPRYLICMQRFNFSTDGPSSRVTEPNAHKANKFSAFNKADGIQRDYTVKDEWKKRMNY